PEQSGMRSKIATHNFVPQTRPGKLRLIQLSLRPAQPGLHERTKPRMFSQDITIIEELEFKKGLEGEPRRSSICPDGRGNQRGERHSGVRGDQLARPQPL